MKPAGNLLMVNTCHATMIYSELVDLGANQCQYNYLIENDALLALDNVSLFLVWEQRVIKFYFPRPTIGKLTSTSRICLFLPTALWTCIRS